MKRFFLITLIFAAAPVYVSALGSFAKATSPAKVMAVAVITDKTKILKAILQGKYIFIHDDKMIAPGEPCFYVYEYNEDLAGRPEARPEKLVVSFHCEPVQRERVNQIVLTFGMLASDLFELREIQFAGSSEGHRVP